LNYRITLIILFFFIFSFSINCNNNVEDNSKFNHKVTLGVDKLIKSEFNLIKGKKVGLFTNFSGRTQDGLLTAEIFSKSKIFNLMYIFSPEHGFFGGNTAGENVNDTIVFGTKMISMYGSSRRPPIEILKQLDVVVIDIQDIGIRSYTFLSSVNYMMTACGEARIPVIILDRPNPFGGNIVDGSVTEKGSEGFMSLIPVAYVHGLTLGEIAIMMNKEGWLKNADGIVQKCDINVIKMDNWRRNMRWDDCNLIWFPTSPQIPSPEAVYGAATLGIFGELSILNIGIGTSLPFRYLGCPEMNENAVFELINKFKNDKEVLIQIAHFKPFYGKFSQKYCKGFIFNYPQSDSAKPYTTGVRTMLAIKKIHPEFFNIDSISKDKKEMFKKVTGGSSLFDAFFSGKSEDEIIKIAQKGVKEFTELRKKYFLYK
jgi:uncharacterized protein YbbC (DUF1343 family)